MSLYIVVLGCTVALLTGCQYRVAYTPSYVPSAAGVGSVSIPGKALLYTEPSDDAYIHQDRPSSLYGGGSKIAIPLGEITRETAARVFCGRFTGGCDRVNSLANAKGYAAIIQPRVISYDYRYNSLRNLTFAMTPQIMMALEVNLYDEAGKRYYTKTCDTGGWFSGKTVLDTMKPAELINRITHDRIAHLLMTAVPDIQSAIASRTVHPAPVPAAVNAPPAVPTGQPPPAVGSGNTPARLKELKKLYDDGLITKEVYEKKQQEILNGL